MAYQRINLIAELSKMAHGKKTATDPRYVAGWALERCKAALAQSDVERLFALYRLEDTRD